MDEKYWLQTPIVGEIDMETLPLRVMILCEPRYKSKQLKCVIKPYVEADEGVKCDKSNKCDLISSKNESNLVWSESDLPEYFLISSIGPTRMCIELNEKGKYTFQWYQNFSDDLGYNNNICNDENSNNGIEWLLIYEHVVYIEEPDKLLFASCDFLEAESKKSMWDSMLSEVNSATMLIHIGDQAYMDGVYKECVKMCKKQKVDDIMCIEIVQKFRDRYYETWKSHRRLLASVSNYNIWDDHEINNNAKLNTSMDDTHAYVTDMAVLAYKLYQENLHINMNRIITDHCWYKRINNMLFLSIERTSRDIMISEILDAVKYLTTNDINRLILCTSFPTIPAPSGKTGSLYKTLLSDKDTLESSKFLPKIYLQELYSGLLDWIDEKQGREVLAVGGDLHFGTHGIIKRRHTAFNVVVSSPITNQPTPERWLASKGLKNKIVIKPGNDNPDDNIEFIPIVSKARRCYCKVDLLNIPMQVEMVFSKEILPKCSKKYISTLLSYA